LRQFVFVAGHVSIMTDLPRRGWRFSR
jgi:hypothetical protein